MHRPRNKGRIIDEISRIEAGGGTVMYPAMEEALRDAHGDAARAQARHHPDRRHLGARRLRGIAQAMAPARITVSTVAVGNDADQTCSKKSPASAAAATT